MEVGLNKYLASPRSELGQVNLLAEGVHISVDNLGGGVGYGPGLVKIMEGGEVEVGYTGLV